MAMTDTKDLVRGAKDANSLPKSSTYQLRPCAQFLHHGPLPFGVSILWGHFELPQAAIGSY
jgi:hypothetical protein